MKKLIFVLLILSTFAIFYIACEAPKSYPVTPEVSFKSASFVNAIDTLDNEVKRVKLTIKVTDGDGDIGIKNNNGQIYPGFEELDSLDLYIDMYEKIEGEFQKVNLLIPLNFATPYLEPEGQNKTLLVNLEVSLDYSKILYSFDTIKYSFYIYDRALHKSNIAESPEIPFDTIGIIQAR